MICLFMTYITYKEMSINIRETHNMIRTLAQEMKLELDTLRERIQELEETISDQQDIIVSFSKNNEDNSKK